MFAPTGSDAHSETRDFPLRISGGMVPNPFYEGSPIVKLIRSVPQVVRLALINHAWTVLIVPNFRDWFPCLLELEMANLDNEVEALRSLPNDLKLETFILYLDSDEVPLETFILYLDSDEVPLEMLLDVVPKTGAKLFKLDKWFCCEHRNNPEFGKIITALRENGVTMIAV